MITLQETSADTIKHLRRLSIQTFIDEDMIRNDRVQKFKEFKAEVKNIGVEIERMNYKVDIVLRGIIQKWKQIDGAAGQLLNDNLELANENLIMHKKLFPRESKVVYHSEKSEQKGEPNPLNDLLGNET